MIAQKSVKRIAIGVIGGTVVLIGVAMIVLPGPAFIVVPAGIAILATEFEWARRWLRKIKERVGAGRGNRRSSARADDRK